MVPFPALNSTLCSDANRLMNGTPYIPISANLVLDSLTVWNIQTNHHDGGSCDAFEGVFIPPFPPLSQLNFPTSHLSLVWKGKDTFHEVTPVSCSNQRYLAQGGHEASRRAVVTGRLSRSRKRALLTTTPVIKVRVGEAPSWPAYVSNTLSLTIEHHA